MRKIAYLVMVLMLIAAGAVYAQFTGSAHDKDPVDFGTLPTGLEGYSNCQLCHTPHLGYPDGDGPLWVNDANTVTYEMYGTTLAGTDADTIGAASLACLSCHDGGIAPDVSIPAVIDSDLDESLKGTHPIGFEVDTTKANLIPTMFSDGSTPNTFKLFGADGNRFECATCHDPHNGANTDPLYRVDVTDVCMGCHDK